MAAATSGACVSGAKCLVSKKRTVAFAIVALEHLGPRRQEEWVVSALNAASKGGVWVRKYSWKVG